MFAEFIPLFNDLGKISFFKIEHDFHLFVFSDLDQSSNTVLL